MLILATLVNNETIALNPRHIISVVPVNSVSSSVIMDNGESFTTKESAQEIMNRSKQ